VTAKKHASPRRLPRREWRKLAGTWDDAGGGGESDTRGSKRVQACDLALIGVSWRSSLTRFSYQPPHPTGKYRPIDWRIDSLGHGMAALGPRLKRCMVRSDVGAGGRNKKA